MKKYLALLLCILFMFSLTAHAEAETVTVGLLSCSLPDGMELISNDANGFNAQLMGYEPGVPQSSSTLYVSINNTWNSCEQIGLTLDWVKAELENPDSQSVFPLVNGGDALFLNGSFSNGYLFALCACYIGEDVYIAYEITTPSQYVPGTYALITLNRLAGCTDSSFLGGMKGVQLAQTGCYPEYLPEKEHTPSDDEILFADENGVVSVFNLDWNMSPHDYLTALANSSGCPFYSIQFGEFYMSDCFTMPEALGSVSSMALFAPGETLAMDIKLNPPEGMNVANAEDAAKWFEGTSEAILTLTGKDSFETNTVQTTVSSVVLTDTDSALNQWIDFCESMDGATYLQVNVSNVVISLERVPKTTDGETVYEYQIWLMITPSQN